MLMSDDKPTIGLEIPAFAKASAGKHASHTHV